MFQDFDNACAIPVTRAQWMALLARAPVPMLDAALREHTGATLDWLRAPETGLMMVQARAGGTGEKFNLGEVTVTRCALRLNVHMENSAVGLAYVLGRSHRQAQLAAIADALLQDPAQHDGVQTRLLTPVRLHLQEMQAQRSARAQSTKVDFFTVARESGGTDDEENAE
jgi:alpha-D-ribose 1-methylphosphonate 5-triphosphate synthase subunit PhnG